MNKTIYVRDEDAETWDRAKELAGEKLSPVILQALRDFVRDQEGKQRGVERIEIRYRDARDNGLPKAKAFWGQWIYSKAKPLSFSDENQYYAVAITAKGNVAIHSWRESEDGPNCQTFDVFPSLEDAANNHEFQYAAIAAMEKRGVPVEELDI
jgi:hypothetical protein